jgi:hypothetical protein
MVHAVALDGISQRANHVLLTDDLVEGLRAVAAVKRGLAGHRADTSGGLDAPPRCSRVLRGFCRRTILESKVSEPYKRLGRSSFIAS